MYTKHKFLIHTRILTGGHGITRRGTTGSMGATVVEVCPTIWVSSKISITFQIDGGECVYLY